MASLYKPFDVRYIPAQPGQEASGGFSVCGYVITGYGPPREVNCRTVGATISNGAIIFLYACDIVRDPIYTYKCTYYPPVPAIPARPARVERTSRLGWDTAAKSAAGYAGDCQLEFSINPVSAAYVGLSTAQDVGTDPVRIRFAFYLRQENFQNRVSVVTRGLQRTAGQAYTSSTVFQIRRVGDVVEFLIDGERVYDEPAGSHDDVLYADTSVFASGDAVPDVAECCTPGAPPGDPK